MAERAEQVRRKQTVATVPIPFLDQSLAPAAAVAVMACQAKPTVKLEDRAAAVVVAIPHQQQVAAQERLDKALLAVKANSREPVAAAAVAQAQSAQMRQAILPLAVLVARAQPHPFLDHPLLMREVAVEAAIAQEDRAVLAAVARARAETRLVCRARERPIPAAVAAARVDLKPHHPAVTADRVL